MKEVETPIGRARSGSYRNEWEALLAAHRASRALQIEKTASWAHMRASFYERASRLSLHLRTESSVDAATVTFWLEPR
jgi:hypothetical protein